MANKGGKFNIVGFLTMVGATVAGAAAAKMAEPMLAKVSANSKIQDGIKIAAGTAAAYFVKNDIVKYAGVGMASQGAYNIVAGFMPKLNGYPEAYGSGETYAASPLPRYSDEVSGIFPEGDIIGAYGESVGSQYPDESIQQAVIGG